MKPLRWLTPLVPVYEAVVRGKNVAYDRGLLRVDRLQKPVISVGNLSTGGSGKTPVVIALAKLLTLNGISVDVLSRGYGRTSADTMTVPRTGNADAALYGDEPVMIARATGVPVFVGRSRFAAGTLAEKSDVPAQIHLLDDGFQHRELARDLDIVVLHASDVSAAMLPAGHLREPLSVLRRAQVVIIREEDAAVFAVVKKHLSGDAQVWRIRRTLACEMHGGLAVAFCGIARPDEFFVGLRSLGIDVAAAVPFPDHHRFSKGDLSHLLDVFKKSNATRLVTTEKDAVRMDAKTFEKLNGIALTVATLESVFLEPDAVLTKVRGLLGEQSSVQQSAR